MASGPSFKADRAGLRELLNSAGVVKMLDDAAKKMAEDCGKGYVGEARKGPNRARGSVVTATPRAMVVEARDHNMIRAAAMLRMQ